MSSLTSDVSAAWHELQDLVKSAASTRMEKGGAEEQFRWNPAGTLVLIGQWQVQARFLVESANYEIRFERFGAELGAQNFELPPGPPILETEIWRLRPEAGQTDLFWRVNGVQVLSGKDLAKRVVDHLRDYYDKYRLAAVGA